MCVGLYDGRPAKPFGVCQLSVNLIAANHLASCKLYRAQPKLACIGDCLVHRYAPASSCHRALSGWAFSRAGLLGIVSANLAPVGTARTCIVSRLARTLSVATVATDTSSGWKRTN